MALIACNECGKQISDKAASCPHCGNPMGGSPAPPPIVAVETIPGKAVTTEATGKHHKAMQMAGAVMLLLGMISCASGPDALWLTGLLWLGGTGVYIAGRMGAWWHHG